MHLTWSCWTSCWALLSAVEGLFWSSRMTAWTGWPLMPPAAFVADTQSWKTVLASPVDPEATPVKVPMAPTMNGVPVAPPLALAPAAAGLVPAAPDAALAGVLLELDDAEEEQPAAVRAARAR